ncbi:gpi anchored serine-threonine rich protein [Rutstroemia sp. NJR-2017a BBW]|nr:gpi anchored serine-threonine rich protein [Rutstroemia sp. NJR-2017a BBW]
MRYSYVSAAIMAFAPAVFAQVAGFDAISVPAQDQVVKVGDVLDIKWDPNSVAGTVKLSLLEGATPSTLQYDPVVIATGVNNLDGHFAWTVPASVGSFAAYGIQITLDGSADKTFQWSNHFKIEAAASSSSSVVVSSTSTAAASTSTAAATTSTSAAAASTTAKASTILSTTQISSTVTASAHTTSVVVPVSSAAATPATSIPYPVNNTTVALNPTSGSSSNGTKPTTLTAVASSTSKGSSPSGTGLAVANSASGMAATGVMGLFGSILLALAL